jgi:hypothetical protein
MSVRYRIPLTMAKPSFDIHAQPGHLIRRAQQIAVP